MSTAVSNILNFRQKIENNLSSLQIVKILNGLINSAIEPLFTQSHLVRELILQSLLQTQVDHRRKISIHDKNTATACIIYGVTQNNFTSIKMCELNRNILFKTILYIEPYLQEALKIERKLLRKPNSKTLKLRLHQLSKSTGINTHKLMPLARWTLSYLKVYLEFVQQIAAKYFKFSYTESNKAKFNTKLFVDSEELFKNYLLALLKALDKFDANQGTLTSYITQWMMSAKSAPVFEHQYGVAYSLPANIRKLMEKTGVPLTNMATSINAAHHEIEDDAFSEKLDDFHNRDKLFIKSLRSIKGIKIPFLALDIPIILTEQEISNLKGISVA